jgi:hypothetical protein
MELISKITEMFLLDGMSQDMREGLSRYMRMLDAEASLDFQAKLETRENGVVTIQLDFGPSDWLKELLVDRKIEELYRG